MVKIAVLDLNDSKKQNCWVIGTPKAVPKCSPFYSEQLQVSYNKNPGKNALENEVYHLHKTPIEEYYFVLKGTLKVKVKDEVFDLESMQILCVPPNERHMVLDYSQGVEFLVIRAPISGDKDKMTSSRD